VIEYVVVVAIVFVAGAVALLFAGRDRWGATKSPVAAGSGAYRAGVVSVPRRRRVPPVVALGSILAYAWSGITGLVLVPAGGVLAAMMCSGRGEAVVGGLLVWLIVADGFVVAIALGSAGHALASRALDAATRLRGIVWWSHAHHAATWGTFTGIVAVLETGQGLERMAAVAAALAVPCGIGVAIGALIGRGASRIARLDAEEARAAE
jgi:hypothetical protein